MNVPSNKDEFRFYAAHLPAFEAGDYKLTVQVTETDSGTGTKPQLWDTNGAPIRSAEFSVTGDRFTVHPSILRSCYPPPAGFAQYEGVIPHVIFHRSTFPWERDPGSAPESGCPWVALLVFKEKEIPSFKTVKVSDLTSATNSAGVVWQKFGPERTDDPNAAVSVIDVDWNDLQQSAPTWGELPWLAHARTVQYKEGSTGGGEVSGDDADHLDGGDSSAEETAGTPNSEECAVVVAQRMILDDPSKQTRWAVHLVSLEGAYLNDGTFQPSPSAISSDSKVRLVSLFHWEFVSKPAEPDFEGTVESLLNHSAAVTDGNPKKIIPFALPETLRPQEATSIPDLKALLDFGSVPLPHRLREGGSMVSWYRGPLIPWTTTAKPVVKLALPARSSDSLCLYFEDAGMHDTSYSVAWELGRLAALADRSFSVQLADWKRARARRMARLRQQLDTDLLPQTPPANTQTNQADQLPKALLAFLSGLATLRNIPATHLVPHPSMLPDESIRIVRVDPTWVECLLDGALSIGRHSAHEAGRDATIPVASPQGLLGVILRSKLVDLHPEMEILGWDHNPDPPAIANGSPPPNPPQPKVIKSITDRKLGPGTRLVLYDTDPAFISIGLPPTVLHFGFEVTTDNAIKTATKGTTTGVDVTNCVNLTSGRVNMDGVANAILKFRPAPKPASPPLDMDTKMNIVVPTLMEGAPRVSFSLSNSNS